MCWYIYGTYTMIIHTHIYCTCVTNRRFYEGLNCTYMHLTECIPIVGNKYMFLTQCLEFLVLPGACARTWIQITFFLHAWRPRDEITMMCCDIFCMVQSESDLPNVPCQVNVDCKQRSMVLALLSLNYVRYFLYVNLCVVRLIRLRLRFIQEYFIWTAAMLQRKLIELFLKWPLQLQLFVPELSKVNNSNGSSCIICGIFAEGRFANTLMELNGCKYVYRILILHLKPSIAIERNENDTKFQPQLSL